MLQIVIIDFGLVVFVKLLVYGLVSYLHRIGTAGNDFNWSISEMPGKLFYINGGRGNDKLKILSPFQKVVQKTQYKVDIETAFMGFVDNDNLIVVKPAVIFQLRQQNAVRHKLDNGIVGSAVSKAHLVPHQGSQRY